MKLFLTSIASAVIGGVVTFLVIKHWFTDKPELVFTLSSPIYTSLSDNNRESLQELTIRNNGKMRAERIIVATQASIKDFEIDKYVHTDIFDTLKGANSFEIVYPSLPPDGELKILFKNDREPISISQLTVRHDDGIGTDALKKPGDYELNLKYITLLMISAFSLIGGLGTAVVFLIEKMKRQVTSNIKRVQKLNTAGINKGQQKSPID